MKLLYCSSCGDIFRVKLFERESCSCGKTAGHYVDQLNAVYSGEFAVPLAVWNSTFLGAIGNQPTEDIPEGRGGNPMTWYVVPKNCKTFLKVG